MPTHTNPSLQEFLHLPTPEIRRLVRAAGPKVVVFPINGTRRWFMLEHGGRSFADPIAAYTDIVIAKHIELYKLFFDHGLDTLVTPVIGAEVLETRDEYMEKVGAQGLAGLASRPEFLEFYEHYGVRVRFFGDYRDALQATPYEYITQLFEDLSQKTLANDRCRLFFGVFADEYRAHEFMIRNAVERYRKTNWVPSRQAVVEAYYGEYLEKADLFIGFDRLSVFDYPFLNWGGEDLYFTVAPSLYLGERQLRRILFDHLYSRRVEEPDYLRLPADELKQLKQFYASHQETILGLGHPASDIWLPETHPPKPEVHEP